MYDIQIVRREFQGITKDDFHAAVTRRSDQAQLIFISDWCWFLKWRTRRKALERAFKTFDKRQAKLIEVERFTR